MFDITMHQVTSTTTTAGTMALPNPTEIPAGLLAPPSTVAATLKRVTFAAAANNEVFGVERVDASLIQDLFYSSADYRKFRRDNRKHTRRLALKEENNVPSSPSARAPGSTLRRESFQSMVAQRVYEQKQSAASYAPRSPEQRRVLRACELSTLRIMRTTAILSAATQ